MVNKKSDPSGDKSLFYFESRFEFFGYYLQAACLNE